MKRPVEIKKIYIPYQCSSKVYRVKSLASYSLSPRPISKIKDKISKIKIKIRIRDLIWLSSSSNGREWKRPPAWAVVWESEDTGNLRILTVWGLIYYRYIITEIEKHQEVFSSGLFLGANGATFSLAWHMECKTYSFTLHCAVGHDNPKHEIH